MASHFTIITLLVAVSVSSVNCANILGYFFAPSISHQITYQPIIKELAKRGHNLTVITPNPINDPTLKTLTEIDVQEDSYAVWEKYNISSFGTKDDDDVANDMSPMIAACIEIFDIQMSHPKVQDLIQNNTSRYQFDLVILEYPIPFGVVFKRIFNTSIIGITSLPLHMMGASYIGNPSHPVLFPDLNLPYSNKLTFFQKVHSFIHHNLGMFLIQHFKALFKEIITKHVGEELMNDMDRLSKQYDIVLVNSNPILFAPRPNVPQVIEFSGIHIAPPKELSKDIKQFLDSARDGAVYISFGSNIKSSALPIAKQQMILQVLSELPYNFIWKFESTLENLPKNVRIMKWVPQQDVLRHPNIKLFVTQGGMQSLDEAMYSKTPVLVIPFFGDQLGNAQKAQQAGLGRSLHFQSLTVHSLKSTIVDIINDQRYAQRLEQVYDILTDQPMPALEKTVWWVEYVIRHKGAQHMRCPTVDATIIEYYMIDVIGFLVAVILLALFFIYITVKLMIKLARLCLRRLIATGGKLKKN